MYLQGWLNWISRRNVERIRETFPHRTIDDIKGHRRSQEHKDMVEISLEELQSASDEGFEE